ncbi:MAG TPA: alpha/beta hydrolase [Streptosporangiaceae bacterium]|nr:alpha/beta hydrolase [Streptosporangiaceae bacterium]
MRLHRKLAIAAGAAVAMTATTAAAFPSVPVDRPQPLPALTAPALAARYATDSRMIGQAARAASRAGNQGLARSLDAMRGEHFIDFNPAGQGLAVEVIGNLAQARRVAVLVPGSDTTLATFDSRGTASPGGAAAALAAQARKLDPGAHLAVIAWLGYAAPATLSPGVLTSGDAGQGADALRSFTDDLARRGHQVALICHSYGSVVCGLAAPGLPVTDIAVIGSPGMDASSAATLHTTARVWAGRGAGDYIRYVPHVQLLGLGFGTDPMSPAFGARIFAAGRGGHSSYFRPGGIALRNLAYIALGDPARVTGPDGATGVAR